KGQLAGVRRYHGNSPNLSSVASKLQVGDSPQIDMCLLSRACFEPHSALAWNKRAEGFHKLAQDRDAAGVSLLPDFSQDSLRVQHPKPHPLLDIRLIRIQFARFTSYPLILLIPILLRTNGLANRFTVISKTARQFRNAHALLIQFFHLHLLTLRHIGTSQEVVRCLKFDTGWGIHSDDFGEMTPIFLGKSKPMFLGILPPMMTHPVDPPPTY